MESPAGLLRLSYWVAALADFIVAYLVLIPERMGVEGYVHPMGLMSAVAFSWGVLLLVADRKPVERKWILPPTILVVFLLGVAILWAALGGLIPPRQGLTSCVAVAVVLSLLGLAWWKAREAEG